jgi:hypothetical protein
MGRSKNSGIIPRVIVLCNVSSLAKPGQTRKCEITVLQKNRSKLFDRKNKTFLHILTVKTKFTYCVVRIKKNWSNLFDRKNKTYLNFFDRKNKVY